MKTAIIKLKKWGNNVGNRYKWHSFVLSIAFIGLALFRIGRNDIWEYVILIALIVLGVLAILTFPTRK